MNAAFFRKPSISFEMTNGSRNSIFAASVFSSYLDVFALALGLIIDNSLLTKSINNL